MAASVKYEKALEEGIIPDARAERNFGAFKDVKGLLATEFKFKPTPPIEYQLASPSLATVRGDLFPYPNIHDTEHNLLLFRKASVLAMDDSVYPVTASALSVYASADPGGSALSTIADTDAGAWHFADFAPDIWAATNGKRIVFRMPYNQSNRVLAAGEMDGSTWVPAVACNSLCNFNDRLAIFGLYGDWVEGAEWAEVLSVWKNQAPGNDYRERIVTGKNDTFGKDWVIISEPGGGDKNIPLIAVLAMCGCFGSAAYEALKEYIHFALKQGRILLLPVREAGEILHGRQIGQRLACYGTKTVTYVEMQDFGPVPRKGLPTGIKGRDAAGGDKELNLYMSKSGRPWEIPANGPERDLGRDQIFSGNALGDWLVCYDPVLKYFSLHCSTGRCWWRTRTGLTECSHLRPTALYRPRTDQAETPQLYGVWYTATAEVLIRTTLVDGGTREVWELFQVNLAGADKNAGADRLTVNVYWRVKSGEDLVDEGSPYTVDNRGQSYPQVTNTECEVEIIAADPSLLDGLDYIELIPGTGKPSLEKLLTA